MNGGGGGVLTPATPSLGGDYVAFQGGCLTTPSSSSESDTPSANSGRSRTASASPTMSKLSWPAYDRTPTLTVMFPCTTPTWNTSSTRAPARYIGNGGPGRLLASRLTRCWWDITRTIHRWAILPAG